MCLARSRHRMRRNGSCRPSVRNSRFVQWKGKGEAANLLVQECCEFFFDVFGKLVHNPRLRGSWEENVHLGGAAQPAIQQRAPAPLVVYRVPACYPAKRAEERDNTRGTARPCTSRRRGHTGVCNVAHPQNPALYEAVASQRTTGGKSPECTKLTQTLFATQWIFVHTYNHRNKRVACTVQQHSHLEGVCQSVRQLGPGARCTLGGTAARD